MVVASTKPHVITTPHDHSGLSWFQASRLMRRRRAGAQFARSIPLSSHRSRTTPVGARPWVELDTLLIAVWPVLDEAREPVRASGLEIDGGPGREGAPAGGGGEEGRPGG